MNAQHIPIEHFQSFEEWEVPLLTAKEIEEILTDAAITEQEIIICRALSLLPPDLPPKDRLLFGVMLSNIMDAPLPFQGTEVCFVRDLGQSTGISLHL